MHDVVGNHLLLLSRVIKDPIKYYKKQINVAFSIFNDGDFHSFFKAMLAILDKIRYIDKCTYKKLYKI